MSTQLESVAEAAVEEVQMTTTVVSPGRAYASSADQPGLSAAGERLPVLSL